VSGIQAGSRVEGKVRGGSRVGGWVEAEIIDADTMDANI
jgi:hypothetical protein